jgi:hypothetical protein
MFAQKSSVRGNVLRHPLAQGGAHKPSLTVGLLPLSLTVGLLPLPRSCFYRNKFELIVVVTK